MYKKLYIGFGVLALALGGLFLLKYSDAGTAFVWEASQGGAWLLPLVAVAALLDSINPCAFSVLLITIAFLLSAGRERRDALRLGASYIAGLFVAYLLIGLGILQALHFFGVPHFMGKLGAIAVIVFGILNLLSHFFPQINWLPGIPAGVHTNMASLIRQVSIPAVFLVGVLVALCEFPCTGGPYLMVLGLLHDSQTYLAGFGYLIFYNLLFILPLVAILLVASHKTLLDKVNAWRKAETKKAKLIIGLAFVALGLLITFLV